MDQPSKFHSILCGGCEMQNARVEAAIFNLQEKRINE